MGKKNTGPAAIRKLSLKTMGITKPKDAIGKFVARIAGRATGLKTGDGQYGQWTALRGSFRGKNLLTGETFEARACFLPSCDVLDDVIQGIREHQSAEFAVDVRVVESEKYMYSYDVVSLMDTAPVAPLDDLLAKLPEEPTNAEE